MPSMDSLPPEIVLQVLQYLPVKSSLDFGITSRRYRRLQQCSLTTLGIGVFHSRLSGLFNMMETTPNVDRPHSVQIILPEGAIMKIDRFVHRQNLTVREIVPKYQHCLRSLELTMWDLQEETASLIARLPHLTHLSLRLDHPHTRHFAISSNHWDSAPASTTWNHLTSRSGTGPGLRKLRSLNLERAGLTDYQLRALLRANPALSDLRLRKCFNLSRETFKFLAGSRVGQCLETLHFCLNSNIDDEILDSIPEMHGLKSLSLHGCGQIDSDVVRERNSQEWKIPSLVAPQTAKTSASARVEVDPSYQ